MPWKLLGIVTSMSLPELGDVTAAALATTPRSRGCGCVSGRLRGSMWPCAPVQRVPMRVCLGVCASWR